MKNILIRLSALLLYKTFNAFDIGKPPSSRQGLIRFDCVICYPPIPRRIGKKMKPADYHSVEYAITSKFRGDVRLFSRSENKGCVITGMALHRVLQST